MPKGYEEMKKCNFVFLLVFYILREVNIPQANDTETNRESYIHHISNKILYTNILLFFLFSIPFTGSVGQKLEVKPFAAGWRFSGPGCAPKIAKYTGRKVLICLHSTTVVLLSKVLTVILCTFFFLQN